MAIRPEHICVCCGQYHGGVNETIRCLRAAYAKAKAELEETKKRLAIFTNRQPYQAADGK